MLSCMAPPDLQDGKRSNILLGTRLGACGGLSPAGTGRKLEELGAAVPIIVADSTNERQVKNLVSNTRVLLSTAGPFALLSDTIVAACVDARTHYVDITGETASVRSLIDRFHARSIRRGLPLNV
jgi:short subunit dehydrogenase-like uncharacterized protein